MGRKQQSAGVFELEAGSRIRATLSWSGCADEPTGEAPGQVAVDFDLFLYRQNTQHYVWGSQSVYDNNEGFDYTVGAGQAGVYEVLVSWPADDRSCEETVYEPAGIDIRIFPP
jgi:hypothetical protein